MLEDIVFLAHVTGWSLFEIKEMEFEELGTWIESAQSMYIKMNSPNEE